MGHQIQHICKLKRLVWVVPMVFGVVIMFQCLEFPYGGVTSSLLSATNHQPPRSSPASLAPPVAIGNTTVSAFDNTTCQSDAPLLENSFVSADNSSVKVVLAVTNSGERSTVDIVTIVEIHDILRSYHASVRSMVCTSTTDTNISEITMVFDS